MKISLIQGEIIWHEPKTNVEHFQTLVAEIEDADLIVLPEMWVTGFTMHAHKYYESASIGISAMKTWSLEKKAILIGSLLVREKDDYYNRLFVIEDGEIKASYNKKHLFSLAGEDRIYRPGNEKLFFEFQDWKISANICYDLRFPVWLRNTTDYNLLLFAANWPKQRIEAWKTLLVARAIENQCFVVGVNNVGTDTYGNSYSGDSMIVDPSGNILNTLYGKEGVIAAEVETEQVTDLRQKLPFLKDRDEFELKN